MTAHAVVRQHVDADCAAAFDLVHDYRRRLEWDTLLRSAETVDDAAPGKGVEAVCRARWRLGGLSFRTRYVTYDPPTLAAVVLVNQPPVFATWAASIRHRPAERGSEVVYTLTFTCRPHLLAALLEPVALAAFRWETRRRLRALAQALRT